MQWKRAAFALAPLAALGLAAAAFYGTGGSPGKSACPAASLALADKLRPLARGEIAALNIAANPKFAAPIAFTDAGGAKLTLADLKGRAALVNLWATWCVPCRGEMPALDKLQAAAGGAGFEVVAVNVDNARVERANAFLDEIGVSHLVRYADHSGDAFETLRLGGDALGLPTSLLIDRDGCQIGVVAGPANWTSPEALAAVKVLQGG